MEEVLLGDPRSFLVGGSVVEGFGSLHGFHVEVSDISVLDLKGHAHFKLVVHHHIVLEKASLAIVDTENTFLHVHLVRGHTPGWWVELSSLSALADDGAAAFGPGQPFSHALLGDVASNDGSVGGGFGDLDDTPAGSLVELELILVFVILVLVLILIFFYAWQAVFGPEMVSLESGLHIIVVGNLCQSRSIDGLGWVLLLNHLQHAIVQVLVEVLGIAEGGTAS